MVLPTTNLFYQRIDGSHTEKKYSIKKRSIYSSSEFVLILFQDISFRSFANSLGVPISFMIHHKNRHLWQRFAIISKPVVQKQLHCLRWCFIQNHFEFSIQ